MARREINAVSYNACDKYAPGNTGSMAPGSVSPSVIIQLRANRATSSVYKLERLRSRQPSWNTATTTITILRRITSSL